MWSKQKCKKDVSTFKKHINLAHSYATGMDYTTHSMHVLGQFFFFFLTQLISYYPIPLYGGNSSSEKQGELNFTGVCRS